MQKEHMDILQIELGIIIIYAKKDILVAR